MAKGASKTKHEDSLVDQGFVRGGGEIRRGFISPLRAPWKKNLTMKTWRHDIVTIIRDSITEKLKIRDSVERTVLKLRFSRVRKYFWFREMVES